MKAAALLALASLFAIIHTETFAQNKMSSTPRLNIRHIEKDLDVKDLDAKAWASAPAVSIGRYWSGKAAPATRHFIVTLLWSDNAFYARFETPRHEPLLMTDKPDVSKKTMGLWDRDVCEIFIAPDRNARTKYFEFEIAPTGEWVDLAIEVTPKERVTDSKYNSGMESAARIDKDKVVMAIKVLFSALGKTPTPGDVWLGNLFRCVGKGATRGYLAWQPTKTKTPNFHVPDAFGEFEFGR
jgi:hypothetical protein